MTTCGWSRNEMTECPSEEHVRGFRDLFGASVEVFVSDLETPSQKHPGMGVRT